MFASVHLEQISTGASSDSNANGDYNPNCDYASGARTGNAAAGSAAGSGGDGIGDRTANLARRISIGANRSISANVNSKTGVFGSGSGIESKNGSGSGSGSGSLSLLGGSLDWLSSTEGAHREKICSDVQGEVADTARRWGVDVFLLQIGTTRLSDATFAAEYEVASLEVAKVCERGAGG